MIDVNLDSSARRAQGVGDDMTADLIVEEKTSDARRSRSRCAGLAAERVLDRFRGDTVVRRQRFHRVASVEPLR